MNIMKTNMLLLDNKIMKDDAGNTQTPAPVPSTTEPQTGMKALSFLGMQNLMANPKLAQEVGVMNDTSAPYSSNIAFKGFAGSVKQGAEKAGRKFAQLMPAGLIAVSTLLPSALALTSCDRKDDITINTKIEFDVSAVVAAINALRADIDAMKNSQSEHDKLVLEALNKALAALYQIQTAIQNQTMTIEAFRELVLGKMEEGKLQRSAILEAIIVLQGITEESAVNMINAILYAYEQGQISFQQAMLQIQALLQENNDLLSSILDAIQVAAAKAEEYAKALLDVAKEIDKNGKATVAQQNIMIAQNAALIGQNNILISQGQKLLEKADQLNMSVRELTAVAKLIGKSLEDVMKMSKDEIIAAINAQMELLKDQNTTLENINNGIANETLTIEEAAKLILDLLKNIDANVADIKAMLEEHFAKYDLDMAQIKAIAYAIKKEQQATRYEVKNLAFATYTMANDIRKMSFDLKDIREKLKNGITFDDSQLAELLKRINATQEMSTEQIIAKLDAFLEKQDNLAAKLDITNEKLTKLGFVVSNDVIESINNIGDDLEGLNELNTKLDELIAAVKSLVTSFDLYAKYAVSAHNEEMTALGDIKDGIAAGVDSLRKDISKLIQQGKVAEVQRQNIENYLASLQKQADRIEAKLGRIPTIEEFDVMLQSHDEANQAYYTELINKSGLNPADFSNIEDLLKAIKEALGDFQKTSNGYLADILARIKAMDPTAPDYTAKLERIIELMENFKFECNCQCDCDHNHAVDEGVIDIIG